jgi:hypothetical protein
MISLHVCWVMSSYGKDWDRKLDNWKKDRRILFRFILTVKTVGVIYSFKNNLQLLFFFKEYTDCEYKMI